MSADLNRATGTLSVFEKESRAKQRRRTRVQANTYRGVVLGHVPLAVVGVSERGSKQGCEENELHGGTKYCGYRRILECESLIARE